MVSSFLLLAIIALGNAKPLGLDNDLGRGDLGRSDWPSDSEAFRVRSRDLLRQGYKLTVEDVKPIASASLDQVTTNTLPLYISSGIGLSQRYVQLLNAAEADIGNGTIKNYIDQVYLTPITIGSQEFLSLIDTGSSDTWVVESGLVCTMPKTAANAAGECGFGPAYKRSSTFSASGNEKFSISYSSESASGVMGTETMTLGGITVKDQKFALINSARWRGDGSSSGLIGLAFPSNSATWPLMGEKKDYSPIFTTMYKEGLVAPYFSLALNRQKEGPGALALGGLPGAPIKYNNTWAKSPMQYLTFGDDDPTKKPYGDDDYRLYRLSIDGFSIGSSSVNTKKVRASVDSGTAAMLLPTDSAKAFNSQWQPAATYNRSTGWVVPCNAKAPKFGVKIGGVMLWIDSEDLMTPHEPGMPGNLCASAVQQSSFPGSEIMGSSFLKNVVAVFDVGGAELRFARRIR